MLTPSPSGSRTALGAALLALTGCGAEPETRPTIVEVSPAQAYNDVSIAVMVRGGPFRPSYSVDTGSGEARIRQEGYAAILTPVAGASPLGGPAAAITATDISWQSSAVLVAELPPGIPAGAYDLAVEDPRGEMTALPSAFVSLGPDTSPPIVSLESPADGEILGAGSPVEVDVRVADGEGQIEAIEWTASASGGEIAAGGCAVPAGARQTTCSFSFVAPSPAGATDTLTIEVRATDRSGRAGSDRREHLLVRAPGVASVTPLKGSTLGGLEVSVRGTNFHRPTATNRGTELLFGDLPAEDVRIEDDGTLIGRAPPHAPGLVTLVVRNGGTATRAAAFEYLPPAAVRGLSPVFGSPAGGTPVTVAGNDFRAGETVVLFGTEPLLCPRFVSAQRIEGIVPPGTGVVPVTATNPIGGTAPPSVTYRYAPEAAGSGGPGPTCPAGP